MTSATRGAHGVRIGVDRALDRRPNLGGRSARRGEDHRDREQCLLVARILGEHLLVALARGVGVALHEVELGQVVGRRHVAGIDLQRLVEGRPRGGVVALARVDDALDVPGERIRRLLLRERVGRGQRLVRLAPSQVRADEREVRGGQRGIGAGERLELAQRLLRVAAGGEPHLREPDAARDVALVERVRPLVELRGLRGIVRRES